MSTNTLTSGSQLVSKQSLTSTNGIYRLMVQSNGLLVLQNLQTGQVIWSVGTIGQVRPTLTMQPNGDLVFTEGNPPQVVWDSGTQGFPGAYAVLENNGNLVVFDINNAAVWTLGTAQGAVVVGPSAFLDARAVLEFALANLSTFEKARPVADVNVRDYGASAE